MKKTKIILAAASALAVFSLAACSSNENQDIATMKGGKITVADFYNEAKKESANQSLVQRMIIYKVFENKYGDKVSKEDVEKSYKEQAKKYGDTFESQLKSAGYTTDSYKEVLRQNLAYEAGIKAHIKITDKDLKTAWESFHPEVEAQIIKVDSEDAAKEVKKSADNGDDFTKLVKDKSKDTTTKDDDGKIKFDSQSTDVPTEVKEAAFKLKDGAISDVISATNASTYATDYYVVKMIKNQAKGNDMNKYKKQLKQIATETKSQDQTFITDVIRKELKAANVKIKDNAFENALSSFMTSTSDSSSKKTSTSSSKKTTDSSKKSKSSDSSKESTDSTSETTEATDSSHSH